MKNAYRSAEARVLAALPTRAAESHKGSYGAALLFCGSHAYTGAAILSGMGALRGGAGLVHLLSEAAVLAPARVRFLQNNFIVYLHKNS